MPQMLVLIKVGSVNVNGDASLEILDTFGKWVIPEDNEILISKLFRSPVFHLTDMVEGTITVNNAYSG